MLYFGVINALVVSYLLPNWGYWRRSVSSTFSAVLKPAHIWKWFYACDLKTEQFCIKQYISNIWNYFKAILWISHQVLSWIKYIMIEIPPLLLTSMTLNMWVLTSGCLMKGFDLIIHLLFSSIIIPFLLPPGNVTIFILQQPGWSDSLLLSFPPLTPFSTQFIQ